jgi:hypothetical protein
MFLHDPGNKAPIHTVYVILSVDKDGKEGICGLGNFPMVCGYESNAKAMLEIAQKLSANSDKKVVMAKFRREQ